MVVLFAAFAENELVAVIDADPLGESVAVIDLPSLYPVGVSVGVLGEGAAATSRPIAMIAREAMRCCMVLYVSQTMSRLCRGRLSWLSD